MLISPSERLKAVSRSHNDKDRSILQFLRVFSLGEFLQYTRTYVYTVIYTAVHCTNCVGTYTGCILKFVLYVARQEKRGSSGSVVVAAFVGRPEDDELRSCCNPYTPYTLSQSVDST
jgi:tRNA(Arg) A34 adenosine deaminase TadA